MGQDHQKRGTDHRAENAAHPSDDDIGNWGQDRVNREVSRGDNTDKMGIKAARESCKEAPDRTAQNLKLHRADSYGLRQSLRLADGSEDHAQP